jgi:hypothetical protein
MHHDGLARSLSVLVIAGDVLDLSHPHGRRLAEQETARMAAACVQGAVHPPLGNVGRRG